MLSKTLLLIVSVWLICGIGCSAESQSDLNRKRMTRLNESIKAAYRDQDREKAAPLYEQMIEIMKSEYGPGDAAVGQGLRNYAYLLSGLGRKKDAESRAEQAAKILLAHGTDTTIGNSRLGRYRFRCPYTYVAKCRGGKGDDNSWVSSFEFFDFPADPRQMYTLRIEVFETRPDLPGHFRYATLKDYLDGCYAEDEVLAHPAPAVISGITFERAVVTNITPGDYRANPSKQMATLYFARQGKTVIAFHCRSPVGGFPVTLALLEPAFRTFKKMN